MNKQPVYYLQTDPRWKNRPYRVPGETATIGGSGCGPTSAAMLIETLTGKTFTPVDACKWSVDHGYKALNQGTYYAYFTPQFAAFGLDCQMLNWTNTYGKPDHTNHETVTEKLREGYYAIALMGKGLWTSNGHFVVLWWQDDKVRINDPASTKTARLNGDIKTFRSQVKYYWLIDARAHNKEEDNEVTQEQFNAMMDVWLAQNRDKPASDWAKDTWARVTERGLFDGTAPQNPLTREQAGLLIERLEAGK